MRKDKLFRKSQALLELLLAILVFAIVAASLTKAISSILFANQNLKEVSDASLLLAETQEQIKVISDQDWHSLYNLTKGPCTDSSCHYHIVKNGNQWQVQPGEETVNLGGQTYTRYFVVYNVQRDSSGNIVESGGSDDPLTQKVVVFVKKGNFLKTSSKYISRCYYDVFSQRDWSGGPVGDVVVSGSTNNFATSSNINYSSSGVIMLSQ